VAMETIKHTSSTFGRQARALAPVGRRAPRRRRAIVLQASVMALLCTLMAACARPTLAPSTASEPVYSPQSPAAATFPAPPQPTADVALVLPAPLPTPGGPLTAYPSLNAITDLAFAPDGALWAATYEGLVRWDLADDSYRYVSQAEDARSR
jgi:hypothetical protein